MTTVLFAGDCAPVGIERLTFEDQVLSTTQSVDLLLANLETPCAGASDQAVKKAGPVLRGCPSALRDLRLAARQVSLCLANNHMMDYGVAGLKGTLQLAEELGIHTFGAGPVSEATAVQTVIVGKMRIGLLARCDPQFGIARAEKVGVAPLSPAVFNAVRVARKTHDRVIVSVHGGTEMSRWPSPDWKSLLCALCDAGADVVHAHHPHLYQGILRHDGSWIIFSPGNFVVSQDSWPSQIARSSLGFEFDMENLARSPVIHVWESVSNASRPAEARVQCIHHDGCSAPPSWDDVVRPLESDTLLTALWHEYAVRQWEQYYNGVLAPLTGQPRTTQILRTAARDFKRMVFPEMERRALEQAHLTTLHLFRCKQHSEAIETALSLMLGETPDARTPESARLYSQYVDEPLQEQNHA